MNKAKLKKEALRHAGAWLLSDVASFELPKELTEEEEDFMRQEIERIAEALVHRGEK